MSNPFIGEIRMFAGNFAPNGWAMCNGQLIAISQNTALFSLIGTTYGGNGVQTFALPNLESRVPLHFGQGSGLSSYVQGQTGGVESVTLTAAQTAAHSHAVVASGANATANLPGGNVPAVSDKGVYAPPGATGAMNGNAVGASSPSGSIPHENQQPLLTVTFIISLFGIFPSQN